MKRVEANEHEYTGQNAELDAGRNPGGNRQGAGERARWTEQGVLDDRMYHQRHPSKAPNAEVQACSGRGEAGTKVLRKGVFPCADLQTEAEVAFRLEML